jgi:hypothetical protein
MSAIGVAASYSASMAISSMAVLHIFNGNTISAMSKVINGVAAWRLMA